ncbi:MAG: hypothetical protein RR689_03590, partial [Mucinivorans sp.]
LLRLTDNQIIDNGTRYCESIKQLQLDLPATKGWLIITTSDLPSDFSVDTYTIVNGELVRLSTEVIAEREAAALRAAEQAATAVEIARLKEYLTATDWAVVKCLEIGTLLAKAYPELATRRIEARARINELQRGGGYART